MKLPCGVSLILMCASTFGATASSCERSSGHAAVQRVELYTSEGCSSCPPAERWLGTLNTGSGLMPLAFHVDYWDALGWPDRYADARYSQRQRAAAQRSRSHAVYTPGVFLEGQEFRHWRRDEPPAYSANAQAAMHMALHWPPRDGTLQLQIRTDSIWPAGSSAYVAFTESNLRTEVERGENRGETLQHAHVVRALLEPARADDLIEVRIPEGADLRFSALNAWIETPSGSTWAGVRLPLSTCTQVH